MVRLFNDNESFYKVGITFNTIKERMSYIPYNFEIIHFIESASNAKSIFELEAEFKDIVKKSSYKPEIKFGGHKECLSDVESVLSVLYQRGKAD